MIIILYMNEQFMSDGAGANERCKIVVERGGGGVR